LTAMTCMMYNQTRKLKLRRTLWRP